MLPQLLVQLLVGANCILASPISRNPNTWIWKYVAYKDLRAIDQTVPTGVAGDLYHTYKPFLSVVTNHGCAPYVAVDNTGGVR